GKPGRTGVRKQETGGAGGAAPSGGAPALMEEQSQRSPDIDLSRGGARHGRPEEGLHARPRQLAPSRTGRLRRARPKGQGKGAGKELEHGLQLQSPGAAANPASHVGEVGAERVEGLNRARKFLREVQAPATVIAAALEQSSPEDPAQALPVAPGEQAAPQ